MKVLFENKGLLENNTQQLIVGKEGDKLSISIVHQGEVNVKDTFYLPIDQCYDFQNFVNRTVLEIEEEERKKMPFWKRLI